MLYLWYLLRSAEGLVLEKPLLKNDRHTLQRKTPQSPPLSCCGVVSEGWRTQSFSFISSPAFSAPDLTDCQKTWVKPFGITATVIFLPLASVAGLSVVEADVAGVAVSAVFCAASLHPAAHRDNARQITLAKRRGEIIVFDHIDRYFLAGNG